MSNKNEKEFLDKLAKAVINYNEGLVENLSKEALEIGINPQIAIMDGLSKGMKIVGDLYEKEEYSIPEVLLCADALESGLNILKPHLKGEKDKYDCKIIIGTVEGDIHSIGKNMVKLMYEVGGFDVIDLGEDVDSEKFIEQLPKRGHAIAALSTMMTTTLSSMKKIIDDIKGYNTVVKIVVGGASVTKETADRFSADGFAESAPEALKDVIRVYKTF